MEIGTSRFGAAAPVRLKVQVSTPKLERPIANVELPGAGPYRSLEGNAISDLPAEPVGRVAVHGRQLLPCPGLAVWRGAAGIDLADGPGPRWLGASVFYRGIEEPEPEALVAGVAGLILTLTSEDAADDPAVAEPEDEVTREARAFVAGLPATRVATSR